MKFTEFFKKATTFEPYPYQIKVALAETIPDMLEIPTGAGKTECVILQWLYRRLNREPIPRRLIYCLPRRSLVEQTETRVKKWLSNLGLSERIDVMILMGGHDNKDIKILPHKELIIIGTQDMILSGILNREYGSSPFSWSVRMGLLNNDCFYVMDEVQLMENALPTTTQLQGLREKIGYYGKSKTLWMSATIHKNWLETIDHPTTNLIKHSLDEDDYNYPQLKKRLTAPKTIHKLDITASGKSYDKDAVRKLIDITDNKTSIIIVNDVKRAQDLYSKMNDKTNCILIHSRFRGNERNKLNNIINNIKPKNNTTIISTQVLEAGVDISCEVLITELAPWSSIIQRIGRCNRANEYNSANIYWIDVNIKDNMPYKEDEMDKSRNRLNNITDGESVALVDLPLYFDEILHESVIRKKDIYDLFDTIPDLSGAYTDVSTYVRNSREQMSVNIYYRDIEDGKPIDLPTIDRSESVSIPLNELRKFLDKKNTHGWVFNYVSKEWEKVFKNDLYPGISIMLDSSVGGYDKNVGWDITKTDTIKDIQSEQIDIKQTYRTPPTTLEDHTLHVMEELSHILDDLDFLSSLEKNILVEAARYHDVGKAHAVFKKTMSDGIGNLNINQNTIWAKCPGNHKHSVPGFRHELASSLFYLKHLGDIANPLTAYIIASHHGKIRMGIKTALFDSSLDDSYKIAGLDIKGETICPINMHGINTTNDLELPMYYMHPGKQSWVVLTDKLLKKYGPFKLAYLEALLRTADVLASKKEEEYAYDIDKKGDAT